MKPKVNVEAVQGILIRADGEQRDYLFEPEVYELVKNTGAATIPDFLFLPKKSPLFSDDLTAISGDSVVVKVVSPYIVHKSDVGGVWVGRKDPQEILAVIGNMQEEIPEKFSSLIEKAPGMTPAIYKGLTGQSLREAVLKDIQGFILCRYITPDSAQVGSELLVSLKRTRTFGMIISAGLGGTDTELFAEYFRKGQAVVVSSAEMIAAEGFFELFKKTISYKKLAGLTRGHKRIVADDQLLRCFSAFISLARQFSPSNPKSHFIIEELEINPFSFSKQRMIPLDGLCRFSRRKKPISSRPINKIDKLLHPSSIGVIGVSAEKMNIGRIILNNIIENGYDVSKLIVIHPKADRIDNVNVASAVDALDEKLDLLVLAVSAAEISGLVEEIIDHNIAEGVIIIPGGLEEKEGMAHIKKTIQDRIQSARLSHDNGPVFIGGNSLGILSHPGQFDTLFIPTAKLAKHRGRHTRPVALISQSGAYMIARMSRLSFLDPAYAVSIGNQIDLTVADITKFLNTQDEIKVIGAYMEGFSDLDGLAFAEAVRSAVNKGKQVLFYKAGKTSEGKSAMSGHTASIAGDYLISDSCVRQAGAIVAETFAEFEGFLRLACAFQNKRLNGKRVAALTNAGYEAVGMADNIMGEDFRLEMASFADETKVGLKCIFEESGLSDLVDVTNPLDITPMASEPVYESVVKALLDDPGNDAVIVGIVPLTPMLNTLPKDLMAEESSLSGYSLARRIPMLAEQYDKPMVMVVDSGSLYDPFADALQTGGLPVFRSADQAVRVLGRYIAGRQWV